MNARIEAELLNEYYNKGYTACNEVVKGHDNLLIEEVLKLIEQFIEDNPCAIDCNTNRLIYAQRTKDGLVWKDVFEYFYKELQNKEQKDTMDGIGKPTGVNFFDFLEN